MGYSNFSHTKENEGGALHTTFKDLSEEQTELP